MNEIKKDDQRESVPYHELIMTRVYKKLLFLIDQQRFLLDHWNVYSDETKKQTLEALTEKLANMTTPAVIWPLLADRINGLRIVDLSPEVRDFLISSGYMDDDDKE